MGEWRVLVAETVSSMVVDDVILADEPKFDRNLSDKGSWQVDLITDEGANRGVDFHTYVRPGWYSWIVIYDDVPVQAGPVWTYGYKDNERRLSVSGSGPAGFFSRRVVRRSSGDPAAIAKPENDLTYTNLSLRGIMRELVAENMAQSGYGLPIDLPPSETGTNTRTYRGYDLAMLWDRLVDLSKVENGPEFDFVPQLLNNATQLRWRMDIGTPQLGNPDTDHVWDYGGALSDIDLDVNGSNSPVTRTWVKGSGTEAAMMSGYAVNTSYLSAGYPGLDFVDGDHTSVIEQATLDTYARQDLADLSAAEETWTCSVRVSGLTTQTGSEVSPKLGTWALGDAPLIGVSGHPWIADGDYRKRILGYSQDETATVKLKLGSTPVT